MNYLLFLHTSRAKAGANVHLGRVALICSWAYLRLEVFTDGQLDTVFCPGKYLAVVRGIGIQTSRGYELKTEKRINVTLNQCLPSHFGFRRQLVLFVRWTFSSSA